MLSSYPVFLLRAQTEKDWNPHKNCDWCLPGCIKSEKDRLSNGPTLHVCLGKEMTCTMIQPDVWKIVFWRQDSTVWWLVLALQRDWQWGFNLPSRWLSHPPSCESLLHAIGSSFTRTWKKYGTMACSIAMLVLFTRRVCRQSNNLCYSHCSNFTSQF